MMSNEQTTESSKLDAYMATRGLSGERIIVPDTDELVDKIAADLAEAAVEAVSERGVFHLALSGGSTPKVLYRRLMIDPKFRSFPWDRTHVWIVDDRVVPADDDANNSTMIREYLVEHSDMPTENFHPMPVLDEGGDEDYEAELRQALDDGENEDRLDFVLLGMGGDGHTASLFPKSPALREREKWVVFNDAETIAPPRPRMTMTYRLINAARMIAVLVTGDGKYAALQHVSLTPDDVEQFPVTGVGPMYEDGKLVWYLDGGAALGPVGEEN